MFQTIQDKSIKALAAIASLSLLFAAGTLSAREGFYGISSIGYVSNDLDNAQRTLSLKSASYKLAIGYEITNSWNIEAGFQALGEDIFSNEELNLENSSTELTGLFLAALGKAKNRQGELFYKLGIARVDVTETFLSQSNTCPETTNIIAMLDNAGVCQYSESKLAGILGIGFDFYIHHSTLLRLEVEQMSGEGGYSSSAGFIGLRVNF